MRQMMNSLSEIKGKYKRVDLLEKLFAHREDHVKEYAQSLVTYREEVVKHAVKMLETAEKKDFTSFNFHVNLVAPVNVEDAYTKMITIFEHMTDDIIELSFDDASKLLTDTWDWAVSAKMTNALYASAVR